MNILRLFPLIALVTPLLSTVAPAHEFFVLLVAGPDTNQTDIYDGFRLATTERDGHENETSDGHLGGLDVQISLDVSEGPASEVGQRSEPPDFVVATGQLARAEWLQTRTKDLGAVFVGVPEITTKMQADFLRQGFSDRFSVAYFRPASLTVTESYIAARLIDLAVRSQDDVAERDALEQIISAY